MKMEREGREHGRVRGGFSKCPCVQSRCVCGLFNIEHIEPGVVLFFLFTSCFSTLTEQLRRGV